MRKLVGLTLVIVLGAGVAQAYPGLRVVLRKATCSDDSFQYRITNSNDRAIRYRVVLWNGNGDRHFFMKATVPANGYSRGMVNPDYRARKNYRVSIFRSWQWKPANTAWRRSHHLVTKSADLSGCA